MKEYAVYILTNFNNSVFYTGITNNLKRRLWEHDQCINPNSFTTKYHVNKLVWFEYLPTAEEAIVVEKKIKGWLRIKKIKLIKRNNPSFSDLTIQ
ncbi:MAG: GIY-YIG nuclease family protein [Candidatus Roizmanbacteria bacterium]|nr:GIY-YIG nuclease family protein [Candidatus Roizmanbacteria bacterium]